MNKIIMLMLALNTLLTGCEKDISAENATEITSWVTTEASTSADETQITENNEEEEALKMNVQVGGKTFTANLEDNMAVDALVEMMKTAPVTIEMNDYAGFEKVGSLGHNLPTSNSQTTTQPGDIVLYQGNQIVMFYGSNSWSYTRLGRIDNLTGWEDALGSGNVTVTFSLED